jgi:hypothetical protein
VGVAKNASPNRPNIEREFLTEELKLKYVTM